MRLFPSGITDPYMQFDPRDAEDAAIAKAVEQLRVQALRLRILRFMLRAGLPGILPVAASDTCIRALAELVAEGLLFYLDVDGTFHLTPAGKIDANAAEAAAARRAPLARK